MSPDPTTGRRALGIIAAIAALWALVVFLTGGFDAALFELRVSSSDAARPLIAALVAAALYVALSGTGRMRADIDALSRRLTPAIAAGALAVIIFIVGIGTNSWSAGGPDSYSYVSQADLWLRGNPKVSIPLARAAPWPNAIGTFTPFGYAPVPGETAIAPVTGSGLPLLMAAFKGIAGHAAAFLVVPLSGALLAWTTFLIGNRLGTSAVGLGGAWLVATSPTFLMMYRSPMSDVPAAAFWALATYWTLGRTVRDALLAGLAASIGILTRPNLVPIAALLALWIAADHSKDRFIRALTFAIAVLPGCVAVAAINRSLWGSPLSSGYGEVTTLFSASRVPTVLAAYGGWLIDTHTPVALIGPVMLLAAPARVWPTPEGRRGARLLAVVMIGVWALYSVYEAFGAWWFLRLLLPSWPALCLGTAAGVTWLFAGRVRGGRALTAAALAALGGYGVLFAARHDVFPAGEGERRYATIAELVAAQTEPSAVILSSIHSGALRYYGGRATLRFDLLDEAWLDRAIAWLQQRGRRPYVLVEDWEMAMFRERFGRASRFGDLRLAPILAYRAYLIPGTVYLFDPLRPSGPTLEPPPIHDPRPRSPRPAPPPPL